MSRAANNGSQDDDHDPSQKQRDRDYDIPKLKANVESAEKRVESAKASVNSAKQELLTQDGTDDAKKKVDLAEAKRNLAEEKCGLASANYYLDPNEETTSALKAANDFFPTENLAYKLALQNPNNPTSVQTT